MRFTCLNGHNFFLPLEDLNRNCNSWCTKCDAFYAKVEQVCDELGSLTVRGGLYKEQISIECSQGH